MFASRSLSSFRVPGEFEPQHAVVMIWIFSENLAGMSLEPLHLEMVKTLSSHVPVIIVPSAGNAVASLQTLLRTHDIPLKQISFLEIECYNIWPRDFGIEVLVNDQHQMRYVDCDFSMYSYLPLSDRRCRVTERFDQRLAEHFGITDALVTRLVSEGGDRECNGRGVMMTIEQTEVHKRNPGWTKAEVEHELKRVFHLNKVIWLPQGMCEDDSMISGPLPGPTGMVSTYRAGSANAHIDEFCRFVAPDTIVLAEMTEEEAERNPLHARNKQILDQAFDILKQETDQDGRPFHIVRMPVPEAEYFTTKTGDRVYEFYQTLQQMYGVMEDGSAFPSDPSFSVLPALSYCNFLITNGLLLGQRYWEPGKSEKIKEKDERARDVLQSLFPDRKVVMLPTTALNLGGGGLHCNTRNIPA